MEYITQVFLHFLQVFVWPIYFLKYDNLIYLLYLKEYNNTWKTIMDEKVLKFLVLVFSKSQVFLTMVKNTIRFIIFITIVFFTLKIVRYFSINFSLQINLLRQEFLIIFFISITYTYLNNFHLLFERNSLNSIKWQFLKMF